MDKKEMLNLEVESWDLKDGITIKEYFKNLLEVLWEKGEGFSGKRPFGNSGWEYDLYKPLIKAGVVSGDLDEEGYIDELDEQTAHRVIYDLIGECFL